MQRRPVRMRREPVRMRWSARRRRTGTAPTLPSAGSRNCKNSFVGAAGLENPPRGFTLSTRRRERRRVQRACLTSKIGKGFYRNKTSAWSGHCRPRGDTEGADMLEHGKADAIPEPPVFETYLEAWQAAARRRQDGSDGMVTRVVRSPYGGYVIRSWPLDLLAEPDLWDVTGIHGRSVYAEM